jgi:hypothetical protein
MNTKATEEFKDITNEELIAEISKTNDKQLSKIGTMAYVELFNRTLYLRSILREDSALIEDILGEDAEFKRIYDKFESEIIDLKPVMAFEREDKLDVEELKILRKDIVKLLRCLASYNTEISYTNEIAKDLTYREFLKENASDMEKKIDFDKLYKNVQMFLSEDGRNIKQKVKDITSILPVRISKDKYYDMIGNAFDRTLKEGSTEIIDTIMSRYRTVFNGSMESEYGMFFDRYFRKAQEARYFDFKEAQTSDLNNIYNDTFDTITEINKVSNIVREFGVIVNRLIAISLLRENIMENIKNPDIKLLITDWNNYLDNPKSNQSRVISQYKKVFKELDKKFQDTNNRLQKLTMENFNRRNKIDDELKDALQKAQYVLNYINDYSLEREDIPESTYYEPAGEQYLKQSISSFLEFIDRNTKDLSNIQRKARMRRLISLMDGVFATPNEFFEYFASSINLTSREEESVALVNGILELMNYYRSSLNKDRLN